MAVDAVATSDAVRVVGITKRFPGVVANQDVSFEVKSGTIHALVGENGAGKSTLMKILYGVQRPDEGHIEIDGAEVNLGSPADAIAQGVGMVFQHFQLADNLTVPRTWSWVRRSCRASAPRRGPRSCASPTPTASASTRTSSSRPSASVSASAWRSSRCSTAARRSSSWTSRPRCWCPRRSTQLFANLRELKAQGHTLLFISHKLDEVRAIADEITVIRRGTTVRTVLPGEVTSRQLAELMVGSELPSPSTHESTVTDRVTLAMSRVEVRDAVGRVLLSDIDLTMHAGEVLGIAGVEGNGQAELVETVVGMLKPSQGRILLGTEDITTWSTARRRESGIGVIPEDRHRHGLLLDAPLWENRILGHQTRPPSVKGPWIDRGGAREDAQRIITDYDVRTPGIDTTARALSGGNQQKFIVGREMSGNPRLLIAAHPTRGVDVGAQAAIWDHIRAARREGLAVLLISADLDELIGLSDSIKVLLRGRWSVSSTRRR